MTDDRRSHLGTDVPQFVGAKTLRDITRARPKDSYQPNGLPPIDESLHSDAVIAELQKRAMQVD